MTGEVLEAHRAAERADAIHEMCADLAAIQRRGPLRRQGSERPCERGLHEGVAFAERSAVGREDLPHPGIGEELVGFPRDALEER